MVDRQQLVVSLRDAARALAARRSIRDLDETLGLIVAAAVDTVPAAVAAGISITENRQVVSRTPTSSAVAKLDALQSELFEGPCITAIDDPSDDGSIHARDLDGDDRQRWPRFAPEAVDAGYRSILSIQLHTGGGVRAALNLYASGPDAFDADDRFTAGLFGVQAAMLLYGSDSASHLQRALDSRDVIGQAKGILMERFTVDDDEAFQMLVHSSQDTNLKLVDVALWLQHEARERSAHRVSGGSDT